MRKVTAGLFQSVDGVVESPHLWQFDAFDDGVGAAMDAVLQGVDTVLLGRTSYDEWSGYWPSAANDDEFGAFINPVRKLVASRTLRGPLAWENAEVIDGDLLDVVRALKAGDGGEIAVCGSISIVRQLLFAGLLDTLTLIVHPVVAGAGKRLFEPSDPTTRFRLVESQITPSGNAIVTYALRQD